MKKYIQLLSTLILTAMLLTSCGSGSNSVFVSLAILVEPAAGVYDIGRTAQYKAYALRLDETWVEVTEQVEWTTFDPSIAIISESGVLTALTVGKTRVIATLESDSAEAAVYVEDKKPVDLIIEPVNETIPSGYSLDYQALAIYDDDTRDEVTEETFWSSSDSNVATVSSSGSDAGKAHAVNVGDTDITAQFDGLMKSTTLTVSPAVLTEIQVTPVIANTPQGTTVQYSATGIYSDDISTIFEDITNDVTWQSSVPVVAMISNTDPGLAEAVAVGETIISAFLFGIEGTALLRVSPSDITSVQVTPAVVSLTNGTFEKMTATVFYADNTHKDVTAEATWTSSDPAVVAVGVGEEFGGLVRGLSEGSVTITAFFGGYFGNAAVTVAEAVPTRIQVSPVIANISAGTKQQYTATAIYWDKSFQDITAEATWQSSSPSVASVSNTEPGLAEALTPGNTGITASLNEIVGQAILLVSETQVRQIQITPANPNLPAGTRLQFNATALFEDGTTQDVTTQAIWQSSNPDTISMITSGDNAGQAVLLQEGTAEITATYGEDSDTVPVHITGPTLTRIHVSPVLSSIPSGLERQYHAEGIFSDGSRSSLDEEVTWRSEDISVATITTFGIASALTPGVTVISAAFKQVVRESVLSEVVGQAVLAVSTAAVSEIQITPANPNLPAGTRVQFAATAHLNDGTTQDVTTQATWGSSDPQTVSMITSGDDAGLAVLLKEGTAEITTTYGGVFDTVAVTVSATDLIKIQVSPVLTLVPSGLDIQYHAEGIFRDGSKSSLDEEVSWWSEDIRVATITTSGLAHTLTPGDTIISATLGEIVGNAVLPVIEAQVTGIQITPANPNLPAGTTVQFTAITKRTDGTTEDVTDQATWDSSDSQTVSMITSGDDAGLAVLLKEGTADISVNYDAFSDIVAVQVTAPVLDEIQVTPVVEVVPSGLDIQYHAQGVFSDGSKSSLDDDVDWWSEDIRVATITDVGFATALIPGDTIISATLGEIVGQAVLKVSSARATQIQITPGVLNEPAGTSGHLVATALMTDGTTEDVTLQATWVSTDPTVAFVGNFGDNSGFVILRAPGPAYITATYRGVPDDISDTIPVEVTSAELRSIQVSPLLFSVPEGLTVQYSAQGVYSDGKITPIDSDVSWGTSLSNVATINQDGLAQALDVGDTIISATLLDIEGQADLQVTSAQTVEIQITPGNISEPAGTSGFLAATAILTDGTSNDVTKDVTWTSSAPGVATVANDDENAGFIRFLSTGDFVITAGLAARINQGSQIQDSINGTVTDAELVEILLSPVLYKMPLGQVVQFTADGVFTDGSRTPINSDVNWLSSNIDIVTIEPSGLADSISEGPVTITATHPSEIVASTTLTVTPAVIERIEMEPQNLSLAVGSTKQFLITAILSDGSTLPIDEGIIWQSSDPLVAVIDQGLLTALSRGGTTITALLSEYELSDSSQVTVTAAPLVEITLSTDQPIIHEGEVAYFLATGEYSNGTLQDLTDDVTWISSDTAIAIVNNEAGSKGEVFGEEIGEADIQVLFEDLTANHPIIVTAAPLNSITVEPAAGTIAVGLSQQYKAFGNYEDGSTEDITWNVNWTSTNPAVAEVDAFGLATSLTGGTTIIEASRDTITGTSSLTVDPDLPSDLEVEPAASDIAKGTGIKFIAILTTNGVENDITTQAVWSSSDASVATISNAAGRQGYAQSVNEGTTTITAEYFHVPSETNFTVTATLNVLNLGNPDRVEVRPTDADSPSIAVNETLQFRLIGFWEISPGIYLEQDITADSNTQWKSSDKKAVAISNDANQGLATGLKAGNSQIEGKWKGVNDSTYLTVTSP